MNQLPAELYRQKVKQMAGQDERLRKFLLLVTTGFLLIVVVLPLTQLFWKAFENNDGQIVGLANFVKYFSTPFLVHSLYNTVYISLATTIISVTLAFIYAYAVTRTGIPWRGFFKNIALLPLFAPTMMYGIALIYLFGNKGLITTGCFGLVPGFDLTIYGPVGIILSEIIYTFPQAFLILSVALAMTDYRLYEAAETLGAGKLRKFFTVTLPGVKYGLISAAIICFTLSFTDFGAPKIIGGQFNVLATDIYKQVIGQQNLAMGATVGIILLIPAIVAFLVDRFFQKKQELAISARATPYRLKSFGCRDSLFFGFCLGIALSLLLLLGAVIMASLVKVWPYDLTLTIRYFSFETVAGYGLKAYFTSLTTAALTALFGTILTFVVAYLVEKMRPLALWRQIAYFLSIVPLALPGMVIGLAYILFFNKPAFTMPLVNLSLANPLHWLYGTLLILVLANIVHLFSVPFITATAALNRLDREFEAVADSLAVPFYRTFAVVTVPMCLTAILEIAMYYFVNAMVTISAVIFLYASDLKLASIAIVNMDDAGDTASAAAMSVLIVVTNIIVRFLYELATTALRKKADAWQNKPN